MSEVDKICLKYSFPFAPLGYQKEMIDRHVEDCIDRVGLFWDVGSGKTFSSTLLNLIYRERTGAQIILKALEEPLRQLSANAGLEGSVIVQSVRGEIPEIDGFARTASFADRQNRIPLHLGAGEKAMKQGFSQCGDRRSNGVTTTFYFLGIHSRTRDAEGNDEGETNRTGFKHHYGSLPMKALRVQEISDMCCWTTNGFNVESAV